MSVQNFVKDSTCIQLGLKSYYIVDVDFCNIILKNQTTTKQKSNQLFKYLFVFPVNCCSHHTNIVINVIPASIGISR